MELVDKEQVTSAARQSTSRKTKRKAEAALDDTPAAPEVIPDEVIPEQESIPRTLRFVRKASFC